MSYVPLLKRQSRPGSALVWHLGTNKTGSSFIQSTVLENARTLVEAGLCYPIPDGEIGYAHHSVVPELRKLSATPRLDRYLSQVASCGGDGLVSSEGLIELPWWALLRARLKSRAVGSAYAVLYLRSPAAYLRSMLQENVKHGWSLFTEDHDAFGDLVVRASRSPDAFPTCRISRIVERTVWAFGRSRVALVSFDRVSGEDLAHHFLFDVLGVPQTNIEIAGADRNEGVSLAFRELNRMVNRAVAELGAVPDVWVYSYLRAFRAWKSLPWISALIDFRRSVKLVPAAGYDSEERRTAARFGSLFQTEVEGDRIFPYADQIDLEWCDLSAFISHYASAVSDVRELALQCVDWANRVGIKR